MRQLVVRLLSRICKVHANEEGSALVVVALMMVVLCGFAALAIDVGTLFYEKQTAQAAADAGALAGAAQLVTGATAAQAMAQQIAVQNDPGVTYMVAINAQNTAVTVTGRQVQAVWFAKVLGQTQATLTVSSTAAVGPLSSMVGVVPIGVPNQTFTYGQEMALTQGAGNGQQGNYGYLDLGNGAHDLGYYIQNGYDQPMSIGDQPYTKTGVNAGPVRDAINYRMTASADPTCNSFQTVHSDCPRMVYMPVIDSFDVNGHQQVTVVGFAAFFLDGFDDGSVSGHQQIMGRFVQMVHPGTIGSSGAYGTYGVKLTGP